MLTRLAILSDKILEAGWLAALIVAPLFFNVYSSRVFEPDKITLVRSLALMMIAAWVVKRIEAANQSGLALKDQLRAIPQNNPLIIPTLAVVITYLISTMFSVVPNVSVWGSYQRLEGTYTTFSFITICLIAVNSLRTRTQLERAINTIVVVSLPIAFYGILQHYKLDPLPWGGDTTERVAANMGNSIFVAAYLIMVVPLTLARWIEAIVRLTEHSTRRTAWIAGCVLATVILIGVWIFNFAFGFGLILVFFVLAYVLALVTKFNLRDWLLVATYTTILATQFVAIVFTQSRGPWLGLGAGLFAFMILGALTIMHQLPRVWRTLTLGSIIAGAIIIIGFLVLFNLPSTPFEALRDVPYIGRLGKILDPNSPTARVRELIWQGALQLVLPHQPLWSPISGDDPINPIRPLVGYGPEGMYVAYNPFYPPELGSNLEARNASPDRSHNETFDSLVQTGLLGFCAYILLFISIFYYGLKWLGVIKTSGERNAFIGLWLVGGFVFAIIFGIWRGWHWFGVALPAGMITGFLIFLVADALRRFRTEAPVIDMRRALWLSALIAVFIGHFVEIHFGIAIVSTRTYFWFYAALLVIFGLDLIPQSAPAPVATPRAPLVEEPARPTSSRRKQRRRPVDQPRTAPHAKDETSPLPILAWTAIVTIILVILAYEFVTNQSGTTSPFEIIQRSFFFKGLDVTPGVFYLLLITWVLAGIIGLAERGTSLAIPSSNLTYDIALYAILSFTGLLWFALVQTRLITSQGDLTQAFISLISIFYIAFFLLVGVLAVALWLDVIPRPLTFVRSPLNMIVAPLLVVVVSALVYATNYTSITADILYKAGSNYDASGSWDNSINAYQQAFALQPTQDFYALFLGRAHLEAGRAATDLTKRATQISTSEKVLRLAQTFNPLNTDHTANLARLHRILAGLTNDPTQRAEEYRQASDYYQNATRLSPNTAYLRNEWALTFLQSGEPDKAFEQLQVSLKLDRQFAQTYQYLGEYYRIKNEPSAAVDNYLKAIEIDPNILFESDGSLQAGPAAIFTQPAYIQRAIDAYRTIAKNNPESAAPHRALADLYKRLGQTDLMRQELEQAAKAAPNDLMTNINLVNYYSDAGQIDNAVNAMKRVIEMVPTNSSDAARFQSFYGQLQNLQKAILAAKNSPNDVTAHRSVAALWKARGQPQFAIPEYQAVTRLMPNDYEAHKNLVLMNLLANRPNEAQTELATVAALAPENDKPFWQNIQVLLNTQKAGQIDQALKAAQAALATAPDADKPVWQTYVNQLQNTGFK